MYCPKCGNNEEEGAVRCTRCGYDFTTRPSGSPAENAAPAPTVSATPAAQAKAGKRGTGKIVVAVLVAAAVAVCAYFVGGGFGRILGENVASSVSGESAAAEPQESAEDAIRERLEREFSFTENGAEYRALIEGISGADSEGALSAFGISYDDLAQASFEGFDMTVDDIVLDGDKAVATVIFRHKDLSGLGNIAYGEAMEQALASGELYAGMPEEELNKWVGSYLMTIIRDAPIESSVLDINMKKVGDTWSIADDELGDVLGRMIWGDLADGAM